MLSLLFCSLTLLLHLDSTHCAESFCGPSTKKALACDDSGDEAICEEKGCHYCTDDVKPYCVKGWACLLPAKKKNVCLNSPDEVITLKECLDRGCSWCADNPDGFKCMKDTGPNDVSSDGVGQTKRQSSASDVNQTFGDPILEAISESRIRGGGNLFTDAQMICFTLEANNLTCLNHPDELITLNQCIDRGCWWCADNSYQYKCVNAGIPQPLDNCETSTRKVNRCPGVDDGDDDMIACLDRGCHFCPSDVKPNCTEGWACLLPPTDDNVCLNYTGEIITPRQCLDRGCSWCDRNSDGYKCIKDPEEPIDTGAPPPSRADECRLSKDERTGCLARNNLTRCWELGCHYCQNVDARNCIEGVACKTKPRAVDDCRDNSTHNITPRECLDRGCSYCKANDNIKCVRGRSSLEIFNAGMAKVEKRVKLGRVKSAIRGIRKLLKYFRMFRANTFFLTFFFEIFIFDIVSPEREVAIWYLLGKLESKFTLYALQYLAIPEESKHLRELKEQLIDDLKKDLEGLGEEEGVMPF